MSADDELVVRSYRRVFRLERRIYRIDRFVLPVPGGIPLRGLCYFVAGFLAILVAGSLPGLGSLLALAPLPLRALLLPAGLAVLFTQATPDGLPAHRFARTWLSLRLRPRRTWAGRPAARGEPDSLGADCGYSSDLSASELRRSRVRGPARVEFAVPVSLERRRRYWLARPGGAGATPGGRIDVAAGERLEIRP
ncbi:MAG TPA: TcpE family conjugal transfer membrane protein [Gaiellaceae bacterium]